MNASWYCILFCLLLAILSYKEYQHTSSVKEYFSQTINVVPIENPNTCLDFDVLKSNWKPAVQDWIKVSPEISFSNTNQILEATRGYDIIAMTKSFPYEVYVVDQTTPAYADALEPTKGITDPNWAIYTTYNKCAITSGQYSVGTLAFDGKKPLSLDSFDLPFFEYRTSWLVDNLRLVEPTGPADLQFWMGYYKDNSDIDILCFSGPTGPIHVGSTRDYNVMIDAGVPSSHTTYSRVREGEYKQTDLPTYSDGSWILYRNRQVLPFYLRESFKAIDIFNRKVATIAEWFNWAHDRNYDLLNFPTNIYDEPSKVATLVWVGKLSNLSVEKSVVTGFTKSIESSMPILQNSIYYGPFQGGAVRVNDQGILECASLDGKACATVFPNVNQPVNKTGIVLQDFQEIINTSNGVIKFVSPEGAEKLTKINKETFALPSSFDRSGQPIDINRIAIDSPQIKSVPCNKECKDTIIPSTGEKITECKYTDPVCAASLDKLKYVLQTNEYSTKLGLYIFKRSLVDWNYTPVMNQANNSMCLAISQHSPTSATLEVCDPSMLWFGNGEGQLTIADTSNTLEYPNVPLDSVSRISIDPEFDQTNKQQQWIIDEKGRLHPSNNLEQCLTYTEDYPINTTMAFQDQDYRRDTVRNRLHLAACEDSKEQQQKWISGFKLPAQAPIQDDDGEWIYVGRTANYSSQPYPNMTKIMNCPGTNPQTTDMCESAVINREGMWWGGKYQFNAFASLEDWQYWGLKNGYDILSLPSYYGKTIGGGKEGSFGNLDNINNPMEPPLNGLQKAIMGAVGFANDVASFFSNFGRWGNTKTGYEQAVSMGGLDVYIYKRKVPAYQTTIRPREDPNVCLTNVNGSTTFTPCNSFDTAQQWTYQSDNTFQNKKDTKIKTPPIVIDARRAIHPLSNPNLCWTYNKNTKTMTNNTCDVDGLVNEQNRINGTPFYFGVTPQELGMRQQFLVQNTPSSWEDLKTKYYTTDLYSQIQELEQTIPKLINDRDILYESNYWHINYFGNSNQQLDEQIREIEMEISQNESKLATLRGKVSQYDKLNQLISKQTQDSSLPLRREICNGIKLSGDPTPNHYIKWYENLYCNDSLEPQTKEQICSSIKSQFNIGSTQTPETSPYKELWSSLDCTPTDCEIDIAYNPIKCTSDRDGELIYQACIKKQPKMGGKSCEQVLKDTYNYSNPVLSSSPNDAGYYEVYNNSGVGHSDCDSVLSSQQNNMIEQGYNYIDLSSFLYPSCS